jgi:hypothetical protein
LFDLYSSMDAHERGYVRKALSAALGRKPTVSIALYDALAKATSAQDQILKEVAEQYNASHHFSQIKRNLYDMIVRHLRTYHVQSSPRSQVVSLMEESGVLADKNLVEAARERLEQAALLCNDATLYGLEAEIYGIIVSLEKRSTTTVSEESIRALLQQRNRAFQRGMLFTELNILARRALESTQLQGMAGRDLAAELLSHPLLADNANYEEYHHRFIYHNSRQMLLHMLDQVDRGYEEGVQLLQLAKQRPSYRYEANSATIIGNLLVVQLWRGDVDAFRSTLEEYDVLESRSEYMAEEVYFNKVRGQMYLALYTGDVATAKHLADTNIRTSAKYRQRGMFIRQAALCIRATCALHDDDRRTARTMIEASLSEEHAEMFTNVSARLQEILLLLREQHYDVLPYALRSFERWIRTNARSSELLSKVLRYGRAMAAAGTEARRATLAREFHAWCQNSELQQQDTLIAVTVGLKGQRS